MSKSELLKITDNNNNSNERDRKSIVKLKR